MKFAIKFSKFNKKCYASYIILNQWRLINYTHNKKCSPGVERTFSRSNYVFLGDIVDKWKGWGLENNFNCFFKQMQMFNTCIDKFENLIMFRSKFVLLLSFPFVQYLFWVTFWVFLLKVSKKFNVFYKEKNFFFKLSHYFYNVKVHCMILASLIFELKVLFN